MREFKFLYALALITVIAASLSACAQAQKTAEVETSLPQRETFSGSYLAGRFAQRQQDWETAQTYMSSVLNYDGNNEQIIQRTFLLALGSGNFTRARELAEKIVTTGQGDELALIFMSCEAINRGDFKASLDYLTKLPPEGFGQYTKPLLTAWSLAGQGKKADALKILSDNSEIDNPTYRMHAGMVNEFFKDMNGASEHYKVAMANGLNLHTAVMIGGFYERYGRPEITHTIYQGLDKIYPFGPFSSTLSAKDPKRIIAPNVTRPSDGAALALFDLATLLYEKRAYDSAQIYGSLVQLVSPKSPFVSLMMGDIAALHNQYGKAVAHYDAIDTESPIYWLSRIRVTEVYEVDGKIDESIQMLTELAKNPANRIQSLVSLGDVYRRHEQFQNAIEAYNQALDGVKLTEEYWPIIYARGMAEERMNNWGNAEKDLLKALEFQPENPMILNFLAYSWANKGINLEKAVAYAKQAAELRPDDGYILDSYGWALFRLARYQDSINWLEQAVAQVPNDSVLLDHLGDAYWQVGRKNEARHQWRHAHDLSQDSGFKTTVQQKIRSGITVPSQVTSNEQPKL